MRMFVLLIFAACGTLLFAGCDDSPAPVVFDGATMGTQYHITIARPAVEVDAQTLQSEVDAELDRINEQMSTYLPDSEISRFNSQNGTDWFDVSPDFAAVVKRAQEVSEMTAGAFDVTVGPLVNRWNFGPAKTDINIPSEAEIAALKQSVGFQLIEVRDDPPAIIKQRPEVQVDLSAIAKGFAVDRIARLLEARGFENFMAEIGGEIRVRGSNADSQAWRVGIERPVGNTRVVHRVVRLRDAAMATSGDYRNFIELDGRRYSHIIDPRTGYPVDHQLASVSVIADDCLSADAWATALLVLGPEQGFDVAKQHGIRALLIERTETGLVERATIGFEHALADARATESPTSHSNAAPMLNVFLYTLAAFALAVAAMSVGVMISNRRLRGSCGGLAGLKDESGRPLCEVYTNPSEECRLPPGERSEFARSVDRQSAAD